MTIAVLDSNIYVSAMIVRQSAPTRIIQLWKEGLFRVAISRPIKNEVICVLHYPRIRKRYHIEEQDISELQHVLEKAALWTKGRTYIRICRDRKDNMILQCAKRVHADYIVTGDPDLLVLKEYREIPIITPRVFLEKLS